MSPLRQRFRWFAAVIALLVLVTAGSGCGKSSGADPGPVRIGFVASLSGTYQPVGTDMRDGFQLYLDTHNKRLGGRGVNLIVADEGDGAPTALPAATKLIKSDQVVALAGLVSGGSVAGVVPLVTENKVPLVAANGRPELKDPTWVWTTSFLSVEPGAAIAQYVKEHVDGPVYAIGPDYQGGWDELKGFTDAFTKASGKLANPDGKTTFTPFPATNNFLPYFTQVKNSGAKAVYCFYAGRAAVDFVKQYRQSDIKDLPLYGAFLTEGSVLDAQGQAAEGIFNVLNYSPDLDNAANRTFVAAWKARHDRQPTTFAMASYDAAAVLDRAIAAINGPVTPQAINEAIGRLGQIDSPRGAWQFNRSTHAPVQKWYLRQVRTDGRALSNVVVQDLATLGS
jgi:branched-chain amino acid transport system substrate-binding protein